MIPKGYEDETAFTDKISSVEKKSFFLLFGFLVSHPFPAEEEGGKERKVFLFENTRIRIPMMLQLHYQSLFGN